MVWVSLNLSGKLSHGQPYAPLLPYLRSMMNCLPQSGSWPPSMAGSAATSTRLPGIWTNTAYRITPCPACPPWGLPPCHAELRRRRFCCCLSALQSPLWKEPKTGRAESDRLCTEARSPVREAAYPAEWNGRQAETGGSHEAACTGAEPHCRANWTRHIKPR